MKEKLRNIKALSFDSFIVSRSLIVISASMLSNVFAWLFQWKIGSDFSKEDLGTIAALFALSGILPLVIEMFMGGIPKLVAEIKDIDYPDRITKLFFSIFFVRTIISVVLLLVLLATAPLVAAFLNISEQLIPVYSVAVAIGVLFSYFAPFLQGLLRFKAYSLVNIYQSFSKLIVGIVVITFGFGINEIFGGLALTTTGGALLAFLLLRKNIRHLTMEFAKDDLHTLVTYSLGGSLALVGITLMQQVDTIFAKHYFDALNAGIYASTTIIGRVVFFAASPVAAVTLPICASKYRKGENYIKPFLITFLLSLGISLSITVMYTFFSHEIITASPLNASYLPAQPYLPLYSVFMLAFSLLFMFASFFIAISQFRIASLMIAAAITQIIGMIFFHDSIWQLIHVSIVASFVFLFIFTGIFINTYRKKTFR